MKFDESKCPVFLKMDIDKCCGCEACINACPKSALYLKPDSDGFEYPVLKEDACIKCGICTRICPLLNTKPEINEEELCFGLSNKDEEVLINSASGGIFTYIYEEFKSVYPQGYVAGAVYEEDCKSIKHMVSSDYSDFEKMRGSKYFQSYKHNIYNNVRNILDRGEGVLFSGSPCEIGALYRFLNKRYDNLWTVDYICKGTSSPKILREYVEYINNKFGSEAISINMRYKWKTLDCWIPQFLKIEFRNSRSFFHEFYNTELGLGFQILQRQSCPTCPYREMKHYADFTLGDLHGWDQSDSIYNRLGSSVLIVNTVKGKLLWDSWGKENINYRSINKERVYSKNRNPVDKRSSKLRYLLEKYNAVDSVNRTIGIKEKIKMKMPVMLLRKMTVWWREHKK